MPHKCFPVKVHEALAQSRPGHAKAGLQPRHNLRQFLGAESQAEQDALAELVATSKPFISNLERGVKVPSLTTILRLAEALECRVVDLAKVFDKGPR